jgi:hypothetical protein
MVTEEFIAELKRVRAEFEWVLRPDTGYHSERRAKPRFHLRCSARTGPAEDIILDPIGAVCYALNRTLYEHDYWVDAARKIRLPLADASNLIAASNDRTWTGREGKRTPDAFLLSLREQMIRAVGLTPPKV